jgi:hypothetical protein
VLQSPQAAESKGAAKINILNKKEKIALNKSEVLGKTNSINNFDLFQFLLWVAIGILCPRHQKTWLCH